MEINNQSGHQIIHLKTRDQRHILGLRGGGALPHSHLVMLTTDRRARQTIQERPPGDRTE